MRYLLVTYLRKADGKIDEQVTVSNSVKSRDIQTCSIILDFKEQKIDKCVIEGQVIPANWEKMSGYFRQLYPAIIERLEAEASQE